MIGIVIHVRHVIIEQPQQQLDVPVLATGERSQQSRDQRRQGSRNQQLLVRENLEETMNPSDQISNYSSTEELDTHSCIVPVQRREIMPVEDDLNITGNHEENVEGNGIMGATHSVNTLAVRPRRNREIENKTDHRITNVTPPVEVQEEIFRQGGINSDVYRYRTGEALEQQQMIQRMDRMIRLLLLAISFLLVYIAYR